MRLDSLTSTTGWFFSVALVAFANLAQAHPGHTVDVAEPESVAHYLLHPEHLAMPLLFVACAIAGVVYSRYFRRRTA